MGKTLRFDNGDNVGRVFCFFFSFVLSVACHGIVHGAVHKVMCVGDSITSAWSDPDNGGGYREPLYGLLVSGGFEVEFVGQNIIPLDAPAVWGRNEGHSGWTADDILNGVSSESDQGKLGDWLLAQNPDTVLLHIGTNDLYWDQQPPAELVGEVMGIVDAIFAYNTYIDVILAQIINQGNQNPDYLPSVFDNRAETSLFNDLLLAAAMGPSYLAYDLFVVDQEAALDYPDDLLEQWDDHDPSRPYYLHPNAGGYDKMASTWYSGVTAAWVPIPGAVWLLGSGLIGIVGIRKKFKK